ncbi:MULTISPECIES: thiamine/thiamine pyrophosphate ABC transporter permease ThiP [Vibrio]|uniref:Thiamine transport system permease protein ThiP n=1 Tax=Vibrio ostreae TaxID=2841925 RepID=A0A975UEA6_9VIBR|nr:MULTISPECIES: thiamine/thiamine pyrophosphate ABC transporter permease ThiP [Vibrio]QXO19392.1 thiamine/thiamine pyrophosphate ABC transporter permease ThiP [Vibrio ostreae]WGY48659.1 thiamine/thiamine pyrophosphate ABC transporter permease ThiP [Vibrio sp. ABG19]
MQVTVPKTGLWVAALVAAFVFCALAALLWQAPQLQLSQIWGDAYYRHVTWFSFYQALLSTLLSVGLAIPVAHALSRRRFRGRALLLRLFASTLVLPVLVGVFGLLAIYGKSGWIADWLQQWQIKMPFSIYGLSGILLAHVFFNLPYACRLLLHSLESIPAEQHKLCAHLGMSGWDKFRWVEWPRMRQQLANVSGMVFMLCFTSFATVMALGGGPKSTTIELAIYQAIKFDFDLQTGALLALWQMLLCGVLALALQRLSRPLPVSTGAWSDRQWLTDSRLARGWDALWIGLALLLVVPPLLMVVVSGLNSKLWPVLSSGPFWSALGASLQVATLASSLALLAGISIVLTSRHWRLHYQPRRANSIELIGTIILVTPGLVISTGLFLLLRNLTDVFSLAYWIVVAVNALMALPYVVKNLSQPMLQVAQQYQFLCASLGMQGWQRLRLVELRALRKPLAYAFTLSFLLSMGDLSAIALFGSQEFRTLPLYLYQLLGSYQMQAAGVVSVVMLLLSIGLFYLIERLFHSRLIKARHGEKHVSAG